MKRERSGRARLIVVARPRDPAQGLKPTFRVRPIAPCATRRPRRIVDPTPSYLEEAPRLNPTLLIDAVVRQTAALIAQLATSAGGRAPLSQVADSLFSELARELTARGVRQKVAADMFGMALRTFQKRLQQSAQRAHPPGRTLWEAVYDRIARDRAISRAKLFGAFPRDDDATLRGILKDLVQSQLVVASGTGLRTTYRVASPDELGRMSREAAEAELGLFVWATIYRSGPVSADALRASLGLSPEVLQRLLDGLVAERRVQVEVDDAAQARYRTTQLVMPLEHRSGWATAVLDHYQAAVETIVARLRGDPAEAPYPGRSGGSTWTFDVWPGHPHEREVINLLGDMRERVIALQQTVFAYNEATGRPAGHARLTFYLGQSIKTVEATHADKAPPAPQQAPSRRDDTP